MARGALAIFHAMSWSMLIEEDSMAQNGTVVANQNP